MLKLTLEELKAFNGEDGNKSYIAVNGVVYDVTNVKAWRKGKHNGGHVGTDISKRIKIAIHGKRVLKKLPVVGEIVE